jgi:hypothetical protein
MTFITDPTVHQINLLLISSFSFAAFFCSYVFYISPFFRNDSNSALNDQTDQSTSSACSDVLLYGLELVACLVSIERLSRILNYVQLIGQIQKHPSVARLQLIENFHKILYLTTPVILMIIFALEFLGIASKEIDALWGVFFPMMIFMTKDDPKNYRGYLLCGLSFLAQLRSCDISKI